MEKDFSQRLSVLRNFLFGCVKFHGNILPKRLAFFVFFYKIVCGTDVTMKVVDSYEQMINSSNIFVVTDRRIA